MRTEDKEILKALSEAREAHPDLTDLIDFYHELYSRQFEAKSSISITLDSYSTQIFHRRLEQGLPCLTFDDLPISPDDFSPLLRQIVRIMARHWPDREQTAEEALALPPQDTIKIAKEIFDDEKSINEKPSEDRSIAIAVEYALAPYAQRAVEAIAPTVTVDEWQKGNCPYCGGDPDLALLGENVGARTLVCARCDGQWHFKRLGCPFCDEICTEKLHYYMGEDEIYRLYVCESCNRYIKTIDLRNTIKTIIPAVERVITAGMDVAALNNGYVA